MDEKQYIKAITEIINEGYGYQAIGDLAKLLYDKRTKLIEEYVKAETRVSAVRAIMETDMDVGKKTDLVLKVVKGDEDADTYDVG